MAFGMNKKYKQFGVFQNDISKKKKRVCDIIHLLLAWLTVIH